MFSLCSGCAYYYNFACPLSLEKQTVTKECDRFTFQAAKSFKTPSEFFKILAEQDLSSSPVSTIDK